MPTPGQAHAIDDDWRDEVRKRLAAKGWNQSDLARALGCGRNTISRIMSGETKQTPLRPRIEAVLGMRARRARVRTALDSQIEQVMGDMTEIEKARLLERALVILDEGKDKKSTDGADEQ